MAITESTTLSLSNTLYDKRAYFALRKALYFDAVADVLPAAADEAGTAVRFTKNGDMATSTTPISETVDITPVLLTDSTVTLTLEEYANGAELTKRLEATANQNVRANTANIVGFNAGESQDELARDQLIAGTNVIYPGTAVSRATIGPTDTATMAKIRLLRAGLKHDKAQRFGDGFYRGFIDSYVVYDLKAETGETGWSYPHANSSPEAIMNGDMGVFDGVRWIEVPEVKTWSNTGGSVQTVEVYATLVIGQQALAKAYAPMYGPYAKIIHGPQTDRLMRISPISWLWMGKYGIFRQESIRRFECASTVANPSNV